MNWGGFPVGFRFAADEITEAFKKKCWERVFAAVAYSDKSDMFFHEAEMEDPYAGTKVYIAVIASHGVGIIQKNAEMWRRDTALTGALMFYRPLVQENYLEMYAPTREVGSISPDGKVTPTEGVAFLPAEAGSAVFTRKTGNAVLLSASDGKENTDPAIADAAEKLNEHGPGFAVRRLNYTAGAHAVYYAAAFRNGLLYTCPVKTGSGEKTDILYALLPGGTCLADARPHFLEGKTTEALDTFVASAQSWHVKGIELLCDKETEACIPEGCTAVTDIWKLYGAERAFADTDALFTLKKDAEKLGSVPTRLPRIEL